MLRGAAAHLAAMHLSGVLLVLTFLVPPSWVLDAYGAAPSHDPSADVPPFMLHLAVVFSCLSFHVVVQIPSGLLGTWLGRNRTAGICYVFVLTVASVLTVVLVRGVLEVGSVADLLPLWGDFMARGSLALAAYVWLSRPLRTWPVRRHEDREAAACRVRLPRPRERPGVRSADPS
ncbi:hypothetical protein GCM10010254_22280 [Streptomyces chromofuscus]|nr:hypothetical protein GCM10010254_22280 [Streptomyces chromofuscus]